jgi:hypothetical protein
VKEGLVCFDQKSNEHVCTIYIHDNTCISRSVAPSAQSVIHEITIFTNLESSNQIISL